MTIAPSYGGEPGRRRRGQTDPAAEECPICSHKHRDEIRGWAPPREILVAEDEPTVARLIAYNLEQDGYHVAIAGDGVAALRALRERPPDLLVLDLLLPLQSGWQVLRALRSQSLPRGSDLPVLIVSALGCDRLEKQLPAIGAQRVLGKPFSVEELRGIVRELLDARPPTGRPLG